MAQVAKTNNTLLNKLKNNYKTLTTSIVTNGARYGNQIDKKGATMKGILLSQPKVKKLTKNTLTKFSVLLIDYADDACSKPYGKIQDEELMLCIKDKLMAPDTPFEERAFHKIPMNEPIWMSTFQKVSAQAGDVVKLYKFVPQQGDGDRIFLNCGDVKKLSMDGKETLALFDKIPKNQFHFTNCLHQDNYYGGNHIVPVKVPNEKEFETAPGFQAHFSHISDKTESYSWDNKETGLKDIRAAVELSVQQWTNETAERVYVKCCFWPNHLHSFGVTNVNTWMALAPKLLKAAQDSGFVFTCYEDKDKTIGLELNDMDPGNRNEGAPDFGVVLKPQPLFVDERAYVNAAGYQVSGDFV